MSDILIVDDDPAVRMVLKRVVRSWGYEAATAEDGMDALGLLMEDKPAVMLLDIRMPRMDGLALLKEARRVFPYLHVIMLTGVDDESTAAEAMRSGAADYILKPIDLPYLRSTVKTLLALV
jgi:DNA-binding NtrC family response regulator